MQPSNVCILRVSVWTGGPGGRKGASIVTSTELQDDNRLTAGRHRLGDDSSAHGAQKQAAPYRYNLHLWPKHKQRSAGLTFVPFKLYIVSLHRNYVDVRPKG
jgi:hypothetical protein